MEIHFAPMQGYADGAYRRLHAEIYGGVDVYYTPFIRMEHGAPRQQDMRRLRECQGCGYELVPQIIFGNAEEFAVLTDAVKSLGYKRIDLNLGCPYPMQTGKGRGAAMVSRTDVMARVAEMVNADSEVRYSIKMRLGLREPNEWQALLPILNSMPLEHVAMHPRVAKQMYAGELYREQFESLLAASALPVIWNGEIRTIADIEAVDSRYPNLKGVMIGRGLLGRPSLAAEWHSGQEWTAAERTAKLTEMHSLLLAEYERTLCGPTQILQKIKPFWEYMEAEIGHKAYKALRKASSLPRYRDIVAQLDGMISQ